MTGDIFFGTPCIGLVPKVRKRDLIKYSGEH